MSFFVAIGKWPKSSSKWLVICFTEKMSIATATIIFCSRKLGMVIVIYQKPLDFKVSSEFLGVLVSPTAL